MANNPTTPRGGSRIAAALATVFAWAGGVPMADEPKAACDTCSADACECGEKCTAKGCGCCDACKAAGENDSTAKATCQTCGAADCACADKCSGKACGCCDACNATGDAAASAEVTRLRAELASERAARVDEAVKAVIDRNAAKLGRDGRANADKLLRAALTDPVTCAKTLSTTLPALLDSLPSPIAGADTRMRRAGDPDREAEAAMERASSTVHGEIDDNAESVNLDREVRAYMKNQKMEHTPENYRKALAAVLAA